MNLWQDAHLEKSRGSSHVVFHGVLRSSCATNQHDMSKRGPVDIRSWAVAGMLETQAKSH